METLLVIIVLALTIFGISYSHITARNKERMALIQSGLTPDNSRSKSAYHILIIIGYLAIGIAVGIAVGSLIEQLVLYLKDDTITKVKIDNPYYRAKYEIVYVFSTFLCGGISLILAFNFIKKQLTK